ncbi:MAG: glycosyltransferase family 2 protein [Nitrososphaeria archaeon]
MNFYKHKKLSSKLEKHNLEKFDDLKMFKKPFIIACIPAYNEEKTIAKVIIKTQKYVDKVIVCDDGSKDMTAEIAEKLGAIVIKHERNRGKGEALRSLFKKAMEYNADIVVTLDADGQHNPEEILSLINTLKEEEADIVIGSRFLLNAKNIPGYRAIGNRILNIVTGGKITDTQSGFRAYNGKIIDKIIPAEAGMGVDSEILIKALENNLKIVEIPITVTYKVPKSSKKMPLYHILDVIASTIKFFSIRHPLIFYGIPGAILLLIGLSFGIWAVQIYVQQKQLITNIALISIAAIILGLILATTAIILFTIITLLREQK